MDQDTFRILAVLASGEADARGILERIERTAGARRGPTIPTLYRRLSECAERGWIEIVGTAMAASRERGRPGQRYRRITRAGRAAARAEALRSRQFARLLLGEERGGG